MTAHPTRFDDAVALRFGVADGVFGGGSGDNQSGNAGRFTEDFEAVIHIKNQQTQEVNREESVNFFVTSAFSKLFCSPFQPPQI